MKEKTKKRPIATRISQWGSATEIIYSCPNCNCNFGLLGYDEKFCHNCGVPIDWGVLVNCNDFISDIYHNKFSKPNEQKAILEVIDEINTTLESDVPKELTKFNDATVVNFMQKLMSRLDKT